MTESERQTGESATGVHAAPQPGPFGVVSSSVCHNPPTPIPGGDRAAVAGDPASQGSEHLPPLAPWEETLTELHEALASCLACRDPALLYDKLCRTVSLAIRAKTRAARAMWEQSMREQSPRNFTPQRRSTDDLLNSL